MSYSNDEWRSFQASDSSSLRLSNSKLFVTKTYVLERDGRSSELMLAAYMNGCPGNGGTH